AARELLEVDHLLRGRGVAATELRRPARHEVAAVEQRALPSRCPRLAIRARTHGIGALEIVRRRVLVEPRQQLGAERLVLLRELQSHAVNLASRRFLTVRQARLRSLPCRCATWTSPASSARAGSR